VNAPEPITDGAAALDSDRAAIEAIPPGPGMSFRGGCADWWEVGRSYEVRGWLRTSRDPRIATDNFRDRAVTALFGRTGRDLVGHTAFPEEQETVFLPGARFTVERQGEVAGLWVTLVTVARDDDGDEPARDVADEASRVSTVLARSLTLPDATVPRPGIFRGGFGERP
jgi:hypothetical protein